jgi:hypothetical protein
MARFIWIIALVVSRPSTALMMRLKCSRRRSRSSSRGPCSPSPVPGVGDGAVREGRASGGGATPSEGGFDVVDHVVHVLDGPPAGGVVEALAVT